MSWWPLGSAGWTSSPSSRCSDPARDGPERAGGCRLNGCCPLQLMAAVGVPGKAVTKKPLFSADLLATLACRHALPTGACAPAPRVLPCSPACTSAIVHASCSLLLCERGSQAGAVCGHRNYWISAFAGLRRGRLGAPSGALRAEVHPQHVLVPALSNSSSSIHIRASRWPPRLGRAHPGPASRTHRSRQQRVFPRAPCRSHVAAAWH